jgi:hypothetical protein
MNRRVFLLAAAGSLFLAPPVLAAASPEEEIARSLVGQGFAITSRHRTFLGRVRFTAVKGATQREVVVDPASGEILRDYSKRSGSPSAPVRAGNNDGRGAIGGSGGGGENSGGGEGSTGGGESPGGGSGESPSGGGEKSGETAGVKK